LDTITQLLAQPQAGQEPELYQRLQNLYAMVLRLSMKANFNK
jgi:hypothetical protein